MKRIEDITIADMEDVVRTGWAQTMNRRHGNDWSKEQMSDDNAKGIAAFVIDYIKANLDTGKREPMSVEEITGLLQGIGWPAECRKVAKIFQPLTVQQGFVVDWSKAPKDAEGVAIIWNGVGYGCACYSQIETDTNSALIEFIPRPAPKMRQKTREEKISGIVAKIGDNGMLWEYSDEVVDYICRAAGIPLETEE